MSHTYTQETFLQVNASEFQENHEEINMITTCCSVNYISTIYCVICTSHQDNYYTVIHDSVNTTVPRIYFFIFWSALLKHFLEEMFFW